MTDNEKKFISIIETLCSDVYEASDSSIRSAISWAVDEVKDLGFDVESPLGDDEDDE